MSLSKAGLLCYYTFDTPPNGTSILNLTSSQYDLIYTGTAGVVSASGTQTKYGTGSLYNNTSSTGNYYKCTSCNSMTIANGFTFACWVYLPDTVSAGYFVLIGDSTSNITLASNGRSISVSTYGTAAGTNVQFNQPGTSGWHHVLITASYSTPTTTLTIYVDGILTQGVFGSGGSAFGGSGGTNTVSSIYYNSQILTGDKSMYLFGYSSTISSAAIYMDEVLLFNRVLSGSEIGIVYANSYTFNFMFPKIKLFSNSTFFQSLLIIGDILYAFDTNAICKTYNTNGTLTNSNFINRSYAIYGQVQYNNGWFYFPAYGTNQVLRYNSTTGEQDSYIINIPTPLANAQFNNILYIISHPSKIIQSYTLSTGASINANFITTPGGGNIVAIAISNNVMYVSIDETSLWRVITYSLSGTLLNASFITLPAVSYGIQIYENYLYVAITASSGTVNVYSTEGTFVTSLVTGINAPRGIAFYNNYIYVSESAGSGNVYKQLNYFIGYPCFLQGSKILHFDPITNTESYVPVETLQKGTLIKTFMSGYKPVSHIGFKTHDNPADAPDVRDRLYGLSRPEFEPLYLTGRHSVLRNDLSEKEINILRENMGDVYVTENHYRVPIFLDGRAKPYTDNAPVIIWHFALEHPDIYQNYGVMANVILVESSSAEYMTDRSNMELL